MESIIKEFVESGLTEKEAQIYLELNRLGPSKASIVADSLKFDRMDAYRTLEKLEQRNLVKRTLEKPMRFVAVPLEKGFDLLMQEQRNRISRIERSKEAVLKTWRTIPPGEAEVQPTFRLVHGAQRIYNVLAEISQQPRKEVSMVSTRRGIVLSVLNGVDDAFEELATKSKTKVRVICEIDQANVRSAKRFMEFAEVRHLKIDNPTSFAVVDDKEAIVLLVLGSSIGLPAERDSALWTDSKDFVLAQKEFFELMWATAIDAKARIEEIETGKPVGRVTISLTDSQLHEKLADLVNHIGENQLRFGTELKSIFRALNFLGINLREQFRTIGKQVGMDIAHTFKAKTRNGLQKELAEYWSSHDLGRMSFKEEGNGLTIIVDDCLECKESPNVGDTLCTLDEGLIEGIMESKLKVEAHVQEVECYGTGHDHCKFTVTMNSGKTQ
jgi:predicted hydrocarbon binding protein/sugar-specific transcriptional regulator TrmB